MCLPVCPTYAITSQEQSSPRGRIRLIRSVHDGTLAASAAFAEEMNFCLDCQACQTACPAGVRYGELVEGARQLISDRGLEPLSTRLARFLILDVVLGSSRRTKIFGRALRWYQRCGLRDAVEGSRILTIFSSRLHEKHAMLPRASTRFFDETVPETISAVGERRGRVVFLSGCIMNIALADVHRDSIDVLTRNGFEVIVPASQGCCGSLHGHNGGIPKALELAKRTVDLFEGLDFDALIVDSAGCGAYLKEYGKLLSGDPDYGARAERLARKTKDITEFLPAVGFAKPGGRISGRVTYHEACHLLHTQKISRQPREIIASVPGLDMVELPEASWCCGSAGIYNVTRYDDSMDMLARKMENLRSTRADIVVTANPGCHLQLQYGIRKHGLAMKVMHPVSLLKKGYDSTET